MKFNKYGKAHKNKIKNKNKMARSAILFLFFILFLCAPFIFMFWLAICEFLDLDDTLKISVLSKEHLNNFYYYINSQYFYDFYSKNVLKKLLNNYKKRTLHKLNNVNWNIINPNVFPSGIVITDLVLILESDEIYNLFIDKININYYNYKKKYKFSALNSLLIK